MPSFIVACSCRTNNEGTLAKRGRQCSSLEKAVDKAVADKDAMEKRLKEAEAGWKRAVEF